MRMSHKAAFVAIALFLSLGATGNAADLSASFERASREFGVPVEIVRSVAYVSSGAVQRQPSTFTDRPPAYGVMGLRDDDWFGHSLPEAAALLGVSPDLLRTHADANIRGGTALLAKIAAKHPEAIAGDVDSWRGVVAEFSGIPQKEIADLFAQQVLDKVHPGGGRPRRIASLASSSCAGVIWWGDTIPTTNYDATGRAGVPITKVVIHTTEETAAATLSIFQDSARRVSSNYLVNRDGSVWQFVDDANTAYHCGNLSYNRASIGIELEGWAGGSPQEDYSWQTAEQWQSLAALVMCLRGAHAIPLDRASIIGHNQVPDPNNALYWGGASHHWDPGPAWSWDRLMTDLGRLAVPAAVSVASQCTVTTLPQSSAPRITYVWPGEKFTAYDASGPYRQIYLAGREFAPGSASAGGWYHWDGWVPSSCLSTLPTSTRLEVSGAFPTTVEVRDGAQSSSAVLGHIGEGKRFVATGNTQSGFDGFPWYEYALAGVTGGPTGWSSSAHLAVSDVASCYRVSPASSPALGGSTSIATAPNCFGGFSNGTAVSIAASANSGYNFSSWTAANCTLANPSAPSTACTITGAGEPAVTANFTAVACSTLSTSASPAGGGSVIVNTPQNCPGGFTNGTAVAVTASLKGSYTFLNWTATNCTLANANAASTTCSMTGGGGATVTARFRKR
jgi:N-acetyl-anhydromuramyl-L-alanine amidase AmpD